MDHTHTIPANTEKQYFVKHNALPVSCPEKNMTLWNAHPRVYLPLDDAHPEAICPYCDAKFILVD